MVIQKGLDVKIEQTKLPGVLILSPARFGDTRGFFSESWKIVSLSVV